MTIRAIIKTSNLVQLGLVLLLGVCFFWLGRDLREVNGLLHNFYRIDALLSELGGRRGRQIPSGPGLCQRAQ